MPLFAWTWRIESYHPPHDQGAIQTIALMLNFKHDLKFLWWRSRCLFPRHHLLHMLRWHDCGVADTINQGESSSKLLLFVYLLCNWMTYSSSCGHSAVANLYGVNTSGFCLSNMVYIPVVSTRFPNKAKKSQLQRLSVAKIEGCEVIRIMASASPQKFIPYKAVHFRNNRRRGVAFH